MEYLYTRLDPAVQKITRVITREEKSPLPNESQSRRHFSQVVCELIKAAQPTLCVFDLKYSRWNSTWKNVSSAVPEFATTIGIDVPANWASNFDYVIHPGIAKPNGFLPLDNWHWGPEWVLAPRSPEWNPGPGIPRLTVITGSQAFPRFYEWLRPQLARLANSNIEVSWVVGKHLEGQIPDLTREGDPISYVTDEDLAERFALSRAVLTRFGVTAFELVSRGVPTIVLPGWTKIEESEVLELEKLGIALVAKSERGVGAIAHELVLDEQLQLRLSKLSKGVFPREIEHPVSELISRVVGRYRND